MKPAERADHARNFSTSAQDWIAKMGPKTPVFVSALLLVVSSTLLGGASQTNALAQAAVEMASLPLLFFSASGLLAGGIPDGTKLPLILLASILAIPFLQLIPIPVELWSRLPNRLPAQQALSLAHIGVRTTPLSMTPEATWRGFLALIPPAAMFLGAIQIEERQRRAMFGCWLVLAALSAILGALQILADQDSPLYFYEITNYGFPVGFFSNRNHQAAFLLCLMPAAALLAARQHGDIGDQRFFASVLPALYLPLALVSVAVGLSRAGIALSGAAILASVAVALRTMGSKSPWPAALSIGAASAAAIAAVLLFGLTPILERFAASDPGDLRFKGWPIVLRTAHAYLPFGSGVGSFDTIYRTVEPLSQISPTYFNHAHNDYLEVWLETGFAGAGVLAAFVIWFFLRAIKIWGVSGREGLRLAAPCSALVFLLLAHSAVDYPLRTETLEVLLAFACASIAIEGDSRQTRDRSGYA